MRSEWEVSSTSRGRLLRIESPLTTSTYNDTTVHTIVLQSIFKHEHQIFKDFTSKRKLNFIMRAAYNFSINVLRSIYCAIPPMELAPFKISDTFCVESPALHKIHIWSSESDKHHQNSIYLSRAEISRLYHVSLISGLLWTNVVHNLCQKPYLANRLHAKKTF